MVSLLQLVVTVVFSVPFNTKVMVIAGQYGVTVIKRVLSYCEGPWFESVL